MTDRYDPTDPVNRDLDLAEADADARTRERDRLDGHAPARLADLSTSDRQMEDTDLIDRERRAA